MVDAGETGRRYRSNRFGETLESQEKRFEKALEFYRQSPRDFASAKALFDRVEDVDHPGFLNLLGNICFLSESPYFNLDEAKSWFRRAYRYESDDESRDIYAQNYLHTQWKQLPVKNYSGLERDITSAEFIVRLRSKGKEIECIQNPESPPRTKYATAVMASSGYVLERDHAAAAKLYEQHLHEGSSGHLSSSYLNLALHYALGLGVKRDTEKALQLLNLEYFLVSDSRKYPAFYNAIKNFSENREDSGLYRASSDRLLNNYVNKGHAYNITDFWTAHGLDDAAKDVTELLTALAISENWEERDALQSIASAMGKGNSTLLKEVRSVIEKYPDDEDIQEFSLVIYEDGRERVHLSKHHAALYKHFRENQLGIPPISSADRLKKFLEFKDALQPDYKSAFLLYDAISDGENVNWLFEIAALHYIHLNNPYFDLQETRNFLLKGASLGHASSMMFLGHYYQQGYGEKVDLSAAEDWYTRAAEFGRIDAYHRLATLLSSFDLNYNKDPEIDKRIFGLTLAACLQESNMHPHLKMSALLLTGRGCDYMPEEGISYYRNIIEKLHGTTDKHDINILNAAMFNFSTRAFLGLSTPEDKNYAVTSLGTISVRPNDFSKRTLSKEINKFLEIMKIENAETRFIKEKISSLYLSYAEQTEFLSDIENQVLTARRFGKSANISRYMVDMFWMVHKLAEKEEWKDQNSWQRIVRSLHAARYGLTYRDIERSTMTEGPRYNEINTGAPILGDIAKPAIRTESHRVDPRSFVPPEGIYGIDSLIAENGGGIHFNFMDPPRGMICPARILKEDIDVAMVLAFAKVSGPMEPYLSLEGGGHEKIGKKKYPYRDNFGKFEDPHDLFMYKVWDPTWLGHTSYGRTMYIVDNLLTICSSYSKNFSIVDKQDEKSLNFAMISRDIVQEMVLAGGRDPDHESARVMNAPQHIAAIPEGHIIDGKQIVKISLPQINIMVEGSYILGADAQLAKDDPEYALGRKTQRITQRFTELCQIMPVYHRYQQIMGLQHALSTLRRIDNFTLHPDLMKDIRRNYEYYNGLPPVPNNELLSIHLPFTP